MTINCGMDNLYIHMMKHRFQLKKKTKQGMNLKNHNTEQKKPVTEYPENKPTDVNFKTCKITLKCIMYTLLTVLNFTVKSC